MMMMMMKMTRQTARNSPSKPIPPDIIFDIFKRLPVKSLMRFKCISKLCCFIIVNPIFTNSHLSYPPTEPGLLITCPSKLQSAQMFFTADINGGSALHHITIPPRFARYTTHSLNGLVCMDFGLCATVCNPSIGQAITLPFICPTTSTEAALSTSFCVNSFGFDPDTKQYKVLNTWLVAMQNPDYGYLYYMEYRVFTLGTNSWRQLDEGPICYPQRESVCINGIIYFRGLVDSHKTSKAIVIAFDLQTEDLDVIGLPEDAPTHADESDLIKYLGRLAIVDFKHKYENKVSFWILDDDYDDEDDSWVKITITLPWNEIQGDQNYFVVGLVNENEHVLAPRILTKPFYVYYYNVVTCNLRRVEIFGLPEHHSLDLSCNTVAVTFYEENIMPLT